MSIRLRLTFYWASVLSLLMFLAGAAVLLLFQRQQWGRLDSALLEEADTAAEAIVQLGPRGATAVVRRLSEERDLGAGRRVLIDSAGKRIADEGNPTADLPLIAHWPLGRTIRDGRAHIFRYAVVPLRLDQKTVWLVDGVDARAVRDSVARLRDILLLVLPVLLTSSVWVGYELAGRALAPLRMVTSALAEIKPRDLSRRLPSGRDNNEAAALIHSINALLERVERTSAAERRFAADAAHELRTPLAVLRSGIEVALQHRRSAAEYADALENARADALALCSLADDLLTLARLDQELAVERETLDLAALTREVVGVIEPLARAKGLALETHLNGAVLVAGSRHYLQRVLINLLDNALKFTPPNGRISVVLGSHDGRALLRVADSGPGISPGDQPFIFDRFFHGRASGLPGNGLGLSLCREIVELHDGQIEAANLPGSGAEFTVALPSPEQACS
jgi:signal transduction histidine kinase